MSLLLDRPGIEAKRPMPVIDEAQSTKLISVSAEAISYADGAAGTTQSIKLNFDKIQNVKGNHIGNHGDTSLSFTTGTALTTEVPWEFKNQLGKDIDSIRLATMSNGEYMVDYENGYILGKNAIVTSSAVDTVGYKIKSKGNRAYKDAAILTAKAATGAGTAVDVQDYRHLVLSFATDGGSDAALTVKVQGSIQETAPTWASAQAVDNHWDYIEVLDLQSGAAIDGDTGVAVATADDYRLLQVNCDGLKWINVIVTARTEGEVTVKAKCFAD